MTVDCRYPYIVILSCLVATAVSTVGYLRFRWAGIIVDIKVFIMSIDLSVKKAELIDFGFQKILSITQIR